MASSYAQYTEGISGMSRIADAPVQVPDNVEVALESGTLRVTGPRGALEQAMHPCVSMEQANGALRFQAQDGSKQSVAFAGTMRALAANMVTGAAEGFERRLEIHGVGYRAETQGATLNLYLGFSHPVNYDIPEGIDVSVEGNNVVVRGASKELVGQVAADIRSFRPPEPYKGKGIKLQDESINRKEAKKK